MATDKELVTVREASDILNYAISLPNKKCIFTYFQFYLGTSACESRSSFCLKEKDQPRKI